jgi:penicillin amidase
MRIDLPLFAELRRAPLRALGRLARWTLPKTRGTERLRGLRATVEVLRDRWGVPHIYARSFEDAAFAQGWVHAQDRFWQMELNRRVAHGRLSELFGELAFDTDRLLRTVGLARSAERSLALLDAESLGLLEAYARGVNAFLERNRLKRPLELLLLGHAPEPWRPLDTLAWSQMMAWGLSTNWDSELVNAAVVAKLGPVRAARLKGEYARQHPMILHDQTHASLYEHALAEFRAAEAWLPMTGLAGMSNNWVVDGHKSVTGRPLLANDPHLSLQMPSIWYEVHLVTPEAEVTGVSLPGSPGVVIGHNAHLAWGFTAALPDTADLYLERLDPRDSTRYEFRGEWLKAEVRHESIRVRGEATPRRAEVVVTRHGPIVTRLSPLGDRPLAGTDMALALRWIGHDGSRIVQAALGMNRAKNWDEFRQALGLFDAPSMNVVYADREGNIAYHMCGKVPLRAPGHQGRTPVPGWTGDYEWRGTIPVEELPQALNPPQHFFVSANNRHTGAGYPHFLGAETMNGHRARRITELLGDRDKLSLADFARIQVDLHCTPAARFCELLVAEAPRILGQPTVQPVRRKAERALERLRGWDHRLLPSSVEATLYELTLFFAQKRLLEPHLGAELTKSVMGVGCHPVLNPVVIGWLDRTPLTVQEIFLDHEQEWFGGRTRESLLADALSDALVWLERELGPELESWTWGRVHYAGFHHPLGAKKPLDQIFNRGPYPYGGDTNTVWQAAFVPTLPITPEGGFTASYRQIIDVADWDASRAVHTTGQSGHPASRHYDDMIPMWLAGEYHPMLWSRGAVEANLDATLILEPA